MLPFASSPVAGEESKQDVRIGLQYVAEGAAHVVYRIVSLSGTSFSAHPELVGKLFRFRKSIASAVPCAQTVSNFKNRIAPLFPAENLVDFDLYPLPPHFAWNAKLNIALQKMEADGSRPISRFGSYLTPSAEESDAVLVTDMSPQLPSDKLVEFKPKWLVQSPSAPAGSKRCRTCAIREMRIEDGKVMRQKYTGRGHADFCPLDLLSRDDHILEGVIRSLFPSTMTPRIRLSTYRKQLQPLLLRLRDVQAEHGDVGLKSFEDGANQDFSVSMALRDCSVFVKLRRDENHCEIRLSDFDRKTTRGGKLEHWTRNERRLIEEGWYTGTETADSRGMRFCRALRSS